MEAPMLPKDFSIPMAPTYSPKAVEAGWNDWWEAKGFYHVSVEKAKQILSAAAPEGPASSQDTAEEESNRKFVMIIPPPNVTGHLHLGHTLTNAIQDSLTRWHRMRGHVALWVPGTDHAGIATQSVVERRILKSENLTRHDLGREKFLEKVWQWKKDHGSHISYQLRRLGISPDWTREFFTLSPHLNRAVTEAFVRLFDSGLIYRDTRLVCWSPFLKTALSDIEVETEEIDKPTRVRIPGFEKTVEVGMLWVFEYKVKGGGVDEAIEVATTRIETMLGDVAVAVNPNDQRYASLVGKLLEHPFFPEREMRVVADSHVDIEFGTGAVKITPAHDRNDYEIGRRHDLPCINIFTEDGRINELGGEFAGQHRFECRIQIERRLKELGLLVDKRKNEKAMQLPRCSRSNDIVEYMLVPQWWMSCQDVAAKAVDAVKTLELSILPDHHRQTWYYWLENVRDWCISRQLWWGHRIPAYRVSHPSLADPFYVAAASTEEAQNKAETEFQRRGFTFDGTPLALHQDEDVLDTWFSSALLPFSAFGWPDQTPDLATFFPTSLLETGHDILFFWVARMVMMSLLLTGKLPFKTVLLHAMVRDAHGKKMSKSLGNVVDPLEVIEGTTLEQMRAKLEDGNLPAKEVARAADAQKKDFPKGIPECGADALRFGLLAYTNQGRSINLDINRVVAYRCFCNKLWNAVKFALLNFPDNFVSEDSANPENPSPRLQWMDKWILHRLSAGAARCNSAFKGYLLSEVTTGSHQFWLYELCDIYLELLKPRFQDGNKADQLVGLDVLLQCLDWGLRLLHPTLPFVTEELYHRLPLPSSRRYESISVAPYPTFTPKWDDKHLDIEMGHMMRVVREFRSLLMTLEIDPKLRCHGYIQVQGDDDANIREFLSRSTPLIATLARLKGCTVFSQDGGDPMAPEALPPEAITDVVDNKLTIAIAAGANAVNFAQVAAKISKKLENNRKQMEMIEKRMSISGYLEKVPAEIRATNDEKVLQLQNELRALQRAERSIMSKA